MARFVKFPGVSGSYVETDDVNLLDADTAHTQQSVGLWVPNSGGIDLTVSNDIAGPPNTIGGFVMKVDNDFSAGSINSQPITGNDELTTHPVLPSTQYAISSWIQRTVADGNLNVQFRIREYNAVGVEVQNTLISENDVPIGVWEQRAGLVTTQATAAFMGIQWRIDHDGVAADTAVTYIAATLVALGSDPTFVPSLRIVGAVQVDVQADAQWTSLPSDITIVGADVAYSGHRLLVQRRAGGFWLFQRQDATGIFGPTGGVQAVSDGLHDFTFIHDPSVPDWTVEVDNAGPLSISTAAGTPIPGVDQSLRVGQQGGATAPFLGNIFTVTERDGVGGPIVAEFDAADLGL